MRARITRLAGLIFLVQFCGMTASYGQDGPIVSIVPRVRPEPVANYTVAPRADLRVDVPLIQIPVHVTTALGTNVTDLRKENFRVFENGVEQSVTNFAMEDAPLSIGLVFDSSGSMRPKIRKSAEAAAVFFKIANPEDEFFLVEFNDRPKLSVPFTQDSLEIYNRIVRVRAAGRTSLLDAIHLALAQMKHAHNLRKAIVIFSDGGDNRSRYTEREVKEAMSESDVQVYAMGIFDQDDSHKLSREEQDGPRLLTELAEETGGKHYPVDHLDDLPGVCDRIGNELRNQYLLAYMSANAARDGRYRRIKVVLANTAGRPQLKPYYRLGYYAPLQ
jgi:Ca-activated chloride channel family protein